MLYLWSILCLAGFIAVHLSSKHMTFLSHIPRSKLLSAAGGISVAYVFITNDHALRDSYQDSYDHYGKWLLAAGILLGGLVGEFVEINELATALLFSFLAGSVLLNVMKEELPEERRSSFMAFFLGGGLYTVLLLLI
ncbi:hypothetical protein ACFOGI_15125 [Virgibacillus xinjiangensis]|uniref:Zinc transporter, ZIP family n=1 Tax=Virgibacillus xinjiangensis TaxID=393090 RepID=A0ABV7CYW7_9BACI